MPTAVSARAMLTASVTGKFLKTPLPLRLRVVDSCISSLPNRQLGCVSKNAGGRSGRQASQGSDQRAGIDKVIAGKRVGVDVERSGTETSTDNRGTASSSDRQAVPY